VGDKAASLNIRAFTLVRSVELMANHQVA